ncbi:MAG: hypothetical protein KDB27_13455 [Planctomycetales bacterium]|nr:hypothetical protein [Planctomycetales bacterium]
MMKQKFLVINCDATDLEDLRRRIGFERELIPCPSMDEAARILPHRMHDTAVVVAVPKVPTPVQQPMPSVHAEGNGHQMAGVAAVSQNGDDVAKLLERVMEQNGCSKTLAARVDLLEQKIIEHSLNRNGQHRKETAAELGISRVTLYNKMKKFGLLG